MRLLKPVIVSAVIHGRTENTCGAADRATTRKVFLCLKCTFYEMLLRNKHRSTVFLFSLLESPNCSIGQASDIQPHFTSERMRPPREADGGRRNHTAGCVAVQLRGELVLGLQNEHSCLSPVMQAHVSLHTYPPISIRSRESRGLCCNNYADAGLGFIFS